MIAHCPNCLEPVPLDDAPVSCPRCGTSVRLDPAGATREVTPAPTSRLGRPPVLELARTRTYPPAGRSAERGPAHRLGRFELLEPVGAGGYGTVYRARDPVLGREVAVKVLRAGRLAAAHERERFLQEARSLARLRHPGIVPVFEVGDEDGVPYLVSQFVHGVTLEDLLSAGPRPPARRPASPPPSPTPSSSPTTRGSSTAT